MHLSNENPWSWEYALPLILWLCLIHLFSSDSFSGSETSRFLLPLLGALFPAASPEQLELVHLAIRKGGHVFEFGVLSVLAYRLVRIGRDGRSAAILAGVLVLLAAISDEARQALTLSRGPSPVDVGYDCLGATLGIWFYRSTHRRGA